MAYETATRALLRADGTHKDRQRSMHNVIERLNYPFYANHSARFERELTEAIAKAPPPCRRTALFANLGVAPKS